VTALYGLQLSLDAHPVASFTMAFCKFLNVLICKDCEMGCLNVVMMAVRHSAIGVARVATCTVVVFV